MKKKRMDDAILLDLVSVAVTHTRIKIMKLVFRSYLALNEKAHGSASQVCVWEWTGGSQSVIVKIKLNRCESQQLN